jgi:hypothetical protein
VTCSRPQAGAGGVILCPRTCALTTRLALDNAGRARPTNSNLI